MLVHVDYPAQMLDYAGPRKLTSWSNGFFDDLVAKMV
jgi:hypothetical protein